MKLIKVKLKTEHLESVQYIANTVNNEVLVERNELGLFNDFLTEQEKKADADYYLFFLIHWLTNVNHCNTIDLQKDLQRSENEENYRGCYKCFRGYN